MEQISLFLNNKILEDKFKSNTEITFKNRRHQLIHELTEGINRQRKEAGFKPLTEKFIAIKCNQNPFLTSDDELELVKKDCEKKGNYKKLFWLIK